MSDQPILITRLESKIEDLHRDWKNAQAIINSNPTSIQEYIKLKEDTGIEISIRYVSLEAIAEEYHLYKDDREISELKDLIGREIDTPPHADILQSIQSIRDRYRKVYECNGRKFDRYERLAQDNFRKKDMSTNPNEDLDKKSIPNKLIIDRSKKIIIIAVEASVAIAFIVGFTKMVQGNTVKGTIHKIFTPEVVQRAINGGCDQKFRADGYDIINCTPQIPQQVDSKTSLKNSYSEENHRLPTIFNINDREDLFPIGKYKIDNPLLGETFDQFYNANIKNRIKTNPQQKVILYIYGSADISGKKEFTGHRSSDEDSNMCEGNFNKAIIRKKEEKSDRYQEILTEIDLNKSSFRNEDLPNLRARWFQCWIMSRYPNLDTEIRQGIVDNRKGEKFRSVRVSISDQ
jgi:hypothetical protein